MVNLILDSITKQLGTTFGTNYRYYVEDVEQGLERPAFHIGTRGLTMRSISPTLYNRRFPMVIHYFSDDKVNNKKDCYAKCAEILDCIEYLPVENTILRGEEISWQMVEDTLQIFITYRVITQKVKVEEDDMDALIQPNVNIK